MEQLGPWIGPGAVTAGLPEQQGSRAQVGIAGHHLNTLGSSQQPCCLTLPTLAQSAVRRNLSGCCDRRK